jgi:uncharacterized protein (TIGR01370 family)
MLRTLLRFGKWLLVVLVVLLGATASFADAEATDPRLASVKSFALGLGLEPGEVASRLGTVDLAVVDGEETKPGTLNQLRAGGTIVLGYLSIGTIEPYRSWYRVLKPFRLRDRFGEFGEYYARTAAPGYRRAMLRRVVPRILSKPFDGLFLDNTDMVETHPKQRRGMRQLVRRLARRAHRRHLLLFAQNGERSVGPLLRYLDGWNREDVSWTYSFDRSAYVHQPPQAVMAATAALRRIAAAGLLVTATDYVADGDSAAEAESIATACSAGALPFVTDIWLRRIAAQPPLCP